MLNKGNRTLNAKIAVLVVILMALVFSVAFEQEAFAQRINWKKQSPEFVPFGRDDAVMAFDSVRGWVVMFGGDAAGSGTWVWDGKDWKDLALTGPAPRREAAMAFDKRRGVIVMFGGFDFVIASNLIWEFDGEEWAGSQHEEGPVGRTDHAMVYHDRLGVCIMFGGDGVDNSTWAYDGEEWASINPDGTAPESRWGHAMVYDSDRDRIVLYGGAGQNDLLADTWEFDGFNWVDVTPEGDGPGQLREHVMVYDPLRKKTVLFGGREIDPDGFDHTWEWDGERWTQIHPPNRPTRRHESAATYDSWRNRIVLFGGSSGNFEDNRFMDDTWTFPNNPPDIQHEKVTEAIQNRNLVIRAQVVDYDEDEFNAFVFFRTVGETAFRQIEMEKANTVNDNYVATIPRHLVNQPGIQYYIGATDPAGSGTFGFYGGPDDTQRVKLNGFGAFQVIIDPGKARKAGAEWQVLGIGDNNFYKSGHMFTNMPIGNYEIRFKAVKGWVKPKPVSLKVEHDNVTVVTRKYKSKK